MPVNVRVKWVLHLELRSTEPPKEVEVEVEKHLWPVEEELVDVIADATDVK
jgi:hypothetical protein